MVRAGKHDFHIETFAYQGFEAVARAVDAASGLNSIIAIHDRTLGPALGGCRMWPYASDDEALADAFRLARGMTFKAALAGLPFGGGKAVIIGASKRDKSRALLRAFGRFVESFGGGFITGEDVGIGVDDVARIAEETRHVVGTDAGSGDPSPVSALGVVHGIRAAVAYRLGRDSLEGLTVAVQGVGHVGFSLCAQLRAAGANLVISDLDGEVLERARRRFAARSVAPEKIYEAQAEVFAPCALGGILNHRTIPRLRCSIVAGAANNQLGNQRHGRLLRRRGILYAPDYVINAGGLINVAQELEPGGYDRDRALARVARIGDTLARLFALAEARRQPTNEAADRVARERLDSRRTA